MIIRRTTNVRIRHLKKLERKKIEEINEENSSSVRTCIQITNGLISASISHACRVNSARMHSIHYHVDLYIIMDKQKISNILCIFN